MTENEAIEKLRAYHKCQRLQVKGIYEDCNEKLCDNCDLCYAQGNTGEHIKSIEIAISALEKQIPKKPVEMKSTDKLPQGYFACPICGGWVGMDEYLNKFCAGCGQAIDWSDEE